MLVECRLSRIVFREDNDQQYIFLEERSGGRSFPIVIGFFEAAEIHRKANGQVPARPLTHDLLRTAMEALGGKLRCVEIHELRENTFFANLVIDQDGRTVRVDCRPSDAIALAVAYGAAIAVEDAVLTAAAEKHGEGAS
ncbi:MAG: bifunctional nuclease family protein [Planctomycetes bacterium]|nr:bifunctional nuclease family protein [Planctomycetota bacterium]